MFDDDHYYMGGVIAEKLRAAGHEVTIVTPLMELSRWSEYTLEMEKIMSQVLSMGIELITDHNIAHIGDNSIEIYNVYHDEKRQHLSYQSLVLATSRLPKRCALPGACGGTGQAGAGRHYQSRTHRRLRRRRHDSARGLRGSQVCARARRRRGR